MSPRAQLVIRALTLVGTHRAILLLHYCPSVRPSDLSNAGFVSKRFYETFIPSGGSVTLSF